MKTAIGAFTKAIGAVASDATAPSPAAPAPAAASSPGEGFDEIRVPTPDGGSRRLTRAEFEALELSERVALLMGRKMQFFLKGQPVNARDALRSR